MDIYCVNKDDISEMLGQGAPIGEVALHCLQLQKTKMVYFLNQTTYVWNDLAPLQPTFWNGVIGYQELTREEVTKWCWKLRAMLDNETILMWQLREYIHQYPFNYLEVLAELLESFEEILKDEKLRNSRFIIEFLCEKAERKSSIDWWEYQN